MIIVDGDNWQKHTFAHIHKDYKTLNRTVGCEWDQSPNSRITAEDSNMSLLRNI